MMLNNRGFVSSPEKIELVMWITHPVTIGVFLRVIPIFHVSAQPAPSGFEADSVVCSATNRNNGRTAWDGKDEIIGRRNCQNIGTAA